MPEYPRSPFKKVGVDIEPKVDTDHLLLPQVNDAVTPTLAFGDGDTGFYEETDDTIALAFLGAKRWYIDQNFLGSPASGGGIMTQYGASGTTPSIRPNSLDTDVGIGSAGLDTLSLIAGGVEGHRITEAAGAIVHILTGTLNDIAMGAAQHIVLPSHNDYSTPTLAFGDGDTGLYESADDTLNIVTSGTRRWQFTGTHFYYTTAVYGAELNGVNPTATIPGHTFDGDSNTGLGRAAADQMTLIAGGLEGLRVKKNASTVQVIVPTQDNGAEPSIAFGDGDTGIFESSDDTLIFATAGIGRCYVSTNGDFMNYIDTGYGLMNEVPSSTNPVLLPYRGDQNTGIGYAGSDHLSLIAGGIQGLSIREAGSTTQAILPQHNDAVTPSLAFGDGDTGFYESADDELEISIAGVNKWKIQADFILGTVTNAPGLLNETPTATNPSVIASQSDFNTGIGTAGFDILSLIAGGIEGHRITESANSIAHVMTGIVKTPTTQTLVGAGAVDIISANTLIDTTGGAAALTLADGAEGQEKFLVMKADGGAGTLTPTNPGNFATIVFDDVGDSAHLIFLNAAWHWMGGTATLA